METDCNRKKRKKGLQERQTCFLRKKWRGGRRKEEEAGCFGFQENGKEGRGAEERCLIDARGCLNREERDALFEWQFRIIDVGCVLFLGCFVGGWWFRARIALHRRPTTGPCKLAWPFSHCIFYSLSTQRTHFYIHHSSVILNMSWTFNKISVT